jgi:hypothetical protein
MIAIWPSFGFFANPRNTVLRANECAPRLPAGLFAATLAPHRYFMHNPCIVAGKPDGCGQIPFLYLVG